MLPRLVARAVDALALREGPSPPPLTWRGAALWSLALLGVAVFVGVAFAPYVAAIWSLARALLQAAS